MMVMMSSSISQLPKLCVKISILMHRRMWVRSFSTRLTSVTFAEDKVFIFLIICPIAIAYSMGQIIKSVCVCQCVSVSVCVSVHLRALSRSHFLIDIHQNWRRRKYPQKEERVR